MAAWIKMSLGVELGLGPGDCVRRGPRSPSPKGGQSPLKFSADVYCGHTAGSMKLLLGMEVGLIPGDCVRCGPSPLPEKGWSPCTLFFGPFLLWPNSWMHQDATWYRCRPQCRGLCVRWRPSPPPRKGGGAPLPNFRPTSIVAKRLDTSRCQLVCR